MTMTHFLVSARELLLAADSMVCPYHPLLVLEGVAVAPGGQHHLIVSAAGQRAYLGPTQEVVRRRARILAVALARPDRGRDRDSGRRDLAWLIEEWVMQSWEALVDELVDALIPAEFRC